MSDLTLAWAESPRFAKVDRVVVLHSSRSSRNKTINSHIQPYRATYTNIQPYGHIRPCTATCNHTQPYITIYNRIQPYTSTCRHIQPYKAIRPYTTIYNHIQPYTAIHSHMQLHRAIYNHMYAYTPICTHIQPHAATCSYSKYEHIRACTSIFSHTQAHIQPHTSKRGVTHVLQREWSFRCKSTVNASQIDLQSQLKRSRNSVQLRRLANQQFRRPRCIFRRLRYTTQLTAIQTCQPSNNIDNTGTSAQLTATHGSKQILQNDAESHS